MYSILVYYAKKNSFPPPSFRIHMQTSISFYGRYPQLKEKGETFFLGQKTHETRDENVTKTCWLFEMGLKQ